MTTRSRLTGQPSARNGTVLDKAQALKYLILRHNTINLPLTGARFSLVRVESQQESLGLQVQDRRVA